MPVDVEAYKKSVRIDSAPLLAPKRRAIRRVSIDDVDCSSSQLNHRDRIIGYLRGSPRYYFRTQALPCTMVSKSWVATINASSGVQQDSTVQVQNLFRNRFEIDPVQYHTELIRKIPPEDELLRNST